MMQIIAQTHDETVAMYMKGCTKKQLAEMLASCNELLQQLQKPAMPIPGIPLPSTPYNPNYFQIPIGPTLPDTPTPNFPNWTVTCQTPPYGVQ